MNPLKLEANMSSFTPSYRALRTLLLLPLAIPHLLTAQPLHLANGSFESPVTPFVENRLDRWQKSPKPAWYDETGGFTWDQLFGVFRNPAPAQPDHIANCDGAQAIYLFAVPEVGIHQDRVGAGSTFEPGLAYSLTAGVIGGAGGMKPGVSLEFSLYYLDPAGNRTTVAATNIVHDPTRFPDATHFVDVTLHTPTVLPTDPWAGRPIGLRFLSTVHPELAGGYWDLDNLRLAASITVPNGSFESPTTTFVDNRVDLWRKTPKPVWYDESGGFTWDQLSGVFRNPEPGQDDHLENIDASQAFYLFAVPGVGLTLDETPSEPAAGTAPTPTLPRYQPGTAYELGLAVQGGGGGMTNGVTLALELTYPDESGLPQTVAQTIVTHTPASFPSRHHFAPFSVRTPPVQPTDAWAGKPIGIRILSTVDPTLAGGYWNVDQARLTALPQPALLEPTLVEGRPRFVLRGPPGTQLELLVSPHLLAPPADWTVAATLNLPHGFAEYQADAAASDARFYRLRAAP